MRVKHELLIKIQTCMIWTPASCASLHNVLKWVVTLITYYHSCLNIIPVKQLKIEHLILTNSHTEDVQDQRVFEDN